MQIHNTYNKEVFYLFFRPLKIYTKVYTEKVRRQNLWPMVTEDQYFGFHTHFFLKPFSYKFFCNFFDCLKLASFNFAGLYHHVIKIVVPREN
jgi:hypothetical protein